jgi:hypothetical protein
MRVRGRPTDTAQQHAVGHDRKIRVHLEDRQDDSAVSLQLLGKCHSLERRPDDECHHCGSR